MRFVKFSIVGVVVLGLVGFGLLHLSRSRTYQTFGTLLDRVETPQQVVALTFDDGPTPAHTHTVLDILARHDVPATFYVTGRDADAHPDLIRAIADDGHEIGNHSWSHQRMVFMPMGDIRREIEQTDAAIRAGGYDGPLTFRPPFGKKLFGLPWFLSQTDRTTIMWSQEPEQSDPNSAASITDHVLTQTKNGDIILMHVMFSSRQSSRDALPAIITGLRGQGYRFVTVSDLLDGQLDDQAAR